VSLSLNPINAEAAGVRCLFKVTKHLYVAAKAARIAKQTFGHWRRGEFANGTVGVTLAGRIN
jgi:hypothetical protein